MIDGTLPGYWGNSEVTFSAANTTHAKVLVDVSPAAVVAAISGETALPGLGASENAVRQRVKTGGRRVIDGLITSSDSAAKIMRIFTGTQLSLYADMGTVTTTATTHSTITRSAGSFITDGWKVGDVCMAFGSLSAANDGMQGRVTAVAAGTLTLDGTTEISVAETQGAGFRLVRVGAGTAKPVPANSGYLSTVVPVPLLNGAQDPRVDTSGIMLGATGMLIVAMAATLSALPCQVSATAHYGDY